MGGLARVGSGNFLVANRTGRYYVGGGRELYLCRPTGSLQRFTVIWPAMGDWPKSALRILPQTTDQNRGHWAVAWKPGTDVLWYVDERNVGKVQLSNPAEVVVVLEGREDNFSRDFDLPDAVKGEFRKLGFVIGRDRPLPGGNTGGWKMFSATTGPWIVTGTVTDADGKPLADVPISVRTESLPTVDVATTKTNKDGKYRVSFRLDLRTLARRRGVIVKPMLEGFTERSLARAGEFNALFYGMEHPERVNVRESPPQYGQRTLEWKPGPIPSFSERKLLLGIPSRADFVMLPAR